LPKVTLRISDGDSLGLESRISSTFVDLAVLYEDEFVTALRRIPLFTQAMYLISWAPLPDHNEIIALDRIAEIPLVLPGLHNGRRVLIERSFAAAKLKLNVVLEADSLASEMWAVRNNIGCTILPVGDLSHFGPHAFAKPLLIEPPMHLTCSIIHSADLPLTNAGEAVRNFLLEFIKRRVRQPDMPGVTWVAKG
jgi:LysR family transcriptional regulator, nitrogen assimilation regulatory protein